MNFRGIVKKFNMRKTRFFQRIILFGKWCWVSFFECFLKKESYYEKIEYLNCPYKNIRKNFILQLECFIKKNFTPKCKLFVSKLMFAIGIFSKHYFS